MCRLGVGADIDPVVDLAITAASQYPVTEGGCGHADVAVLWFRAGDGDLGALISALAEIVGELIWLFTPAAGHPGHLGDAQILAAARQAGVFAEPGVMARRSWTGTRLHPF